MSIAPQKTTLVLVEEDEMIQNTFREVFGPQYDIVVTKNMKDIHELISKKVTAIMVLSLDLKQSINSFDLLRDIRRISRLPIIVTSQNRIEDVRIAMRFGASDFCMKPLDLTYLKSKIAELA